MQTKTIPLVRPALMLFIALSLITGLLYPFVTTGLAQLLFPSQAAGSLIERNGKIVGSQLIGQHFSEPRYFWGRPSATAPMAYNGVSSGGSNLGPTNPALAEAARARAQALHQADPDNKAPIPVDLLTASGSGLDPHISPEAARYQAARVARERGLPLERVQALIDRHIEQPGLAILGQPVVNVLALNLALDDGV
ncbi:potassium-transporting ATPase subunit KdpC [Bordetella avium]|uniref:Potassium-transporting ATPase KdpC subunit n=3 Tax=Bordetella avium TaxID=521 RepID=Q2KWC5_BORA1|nr:potassium-transporting ATPase subunit KdpC [Bordetella avium]AZY50037.1 potassium-transporting ATPase subunit KdpC [Bordetella avium]AZY53402.1 potassium-transporting ATPase subunit KdpC [Bordetella avium]RIQ13005.1 potassium-transporting ATPase subunit KdpC [Bordetella avium]RIQ17394.1 potassium-transporting ATPase subunit KdpC [Bordetella avium]RIQ33881.1 potassium-transporting ATPase subunit KdpC [Bordetella avium]